MCVVAAGIADRGDVDALARLPEFALRAPEAADAEQHLLGPERKGRVERVAVDEMAARRAGPASARSGIGPRRPARSERSKMDMARKIRRRLSGANSDSPLPACG